MSDTSLNKYVAQGDDAAEAAFTPDPVTGTTPEQAVLFVNSENPAAPELKWWDGANFIDVSGGGGGNVNAGGTLTANQLVIGAGSTDVAELGSLGTTTTVLHGNAAGAPTFGAVVTNDITNANVTLAKIANAAANDKLLGSGNSGSGASYAEISLGSGLTMTGTTLSASAASAGLVLLEQHTASTSASLDFTSSISSTYDDYLVEFVSLRASNDGAAINLLVSTDGGSSYVTSGYQSALYGYRLTAATLGTAFVTNAMTIVNAYDTGISRHNVSGFIKLMNPGNATSAKLFMGQVTAPINDANWYLLNIGGIYDSASAVTDFQIIPSAGTLTDGTVRCYGIVK